MYNSWNCFNIVLRVHSSCIVYYLLLYSLMYKIVKTKQKTSWVKTTFYFYFKEFIVNKIVFSLLFLQSSFQILLIKFYKNYILQSYVYVKL